MNSSFHLSIEVIKYEESKRFYVEQLGGKMEKLNDQWCNINLHGHQITLHNNPNCELKEFKNFHWGVNLDKPSFDKIYRNLKTIGIAFEQEPADEDLSPTLKRQKMTFHDPNGYLLEFKTYSEQNEVF